MSRLRRAVILTLAAVAATGCGGSSSSPSGTTDLKVPPIPPAGKDKDPGGKKAIQGPPPPTQ